MIALFKAIPLGIFLTVIVALFMGSGGATGGRLNVVPVNVHYAELGLAFRFYWSWMLFMLGTGLAWALLLMMGD